MRQLLILSFVISAAVLSGCQSQQAKVDELQKDYDTKANQFQKDCAAEYLKVPPTLSSKCQREKQEQADAFKRLEEERSRT